MGKINRVIWIILDSVGMGELPDAAAFGDQGSNTLGNIAEKFPEIKLNNMIRMGLGNIDGMKNIKKTDKTIGAYARVAEQSNGKDTTVGHWEMIGIHSKQPFPTYPTGFPEEIIQEFIRLTGVPGILGNCVASGTEIIKEKGEEHIVTRKPIIYTSADSVFQIACSEDVYSLKELYQMCEVARKILKGENAVARVIARPFLKDGDEYVRTANRRDFSLLPDKNNLLVHLQEKGENVLGIGKIEDIFAGVGIMEAVHTLDNMDGVEKTLEYMGKIDSGLIFTNLVEFDSKWGHRNDVEGYAKGLEAFDRRLPEIIENMQEEDVLIINADHGCDPTTVGTDHSREYVPLLIYGKQIIPNTNLGTLKTFADIGATIASMLDVKSGAIGKSFIERVEVL